jgi:hypothetical protein
MNQSTSTLPLRLDEFQLSGIAYVTLIICIHYFGLGRVWLGGVFLLHLRASLLDLFKLPKWEEFSPHPPPLQRLLPRA